MDKKQIGMKLKELRGSRTQIYIAQKVGVTVSAWAMYERGERIPRDEVKLRICEYFKQPIEVIFFTKSEH